MLRMTELARCVLALTLIVVRAGSAGGQTTAFTYQGQLSVSGGLATASYDMRFALFDSSAGGMHINDTQTVSAVAVSQGVFTVQLDFGVNAFSGGNRFLEISVRPAATGSYTTLAPRQQISSSPYAIRTLSAATADALSDECVGCVQDSQIQAVSGAKVSGTIPAAGVPSGSTNYIQNSTSQQPNASFNIAGNGTAGNLNVNAALSVGGSSAPSNAPTGQGRIYFDATSNKMRVSENGGAYVNLVGAGGVSGSGAVNTIPLWSAGTTLANSQITQSAAGVQLPANVQLAVTAQGNRVAFGTPNTETGMTISGDDGRADLRFDGTLKLVNGPAGGVPPATNGIAITPAGNVGIGTTTTNYKLDVVGPVRSVRDISNDLVVETRGGTNSWARLLIATPNQRWSLGSSQNFNGDQLSLVDDSSQQQRMTIQPDGGATTFPLGNLGVGNTNPAHRLAIGDGPFWTSSSWKGAVEMTNASAIGWQPNGSSGQSFGIGQSNGGLYFFRTISGPGVTLTPALYDLQVTDNGDLSQPVDRNGVAKAMVYGDSVTGIVNCYNGVSGSSAGSCGFSMEILDTDSYNITFPFSVADRFLSLTASSQRAVGRALVLGNPTKVAIDLTEGDGDPFAGRFYLIVF